MDLIMGEHRIEESGERGNQASPQASTKNRTSVMILSKEEWDTGQAVVLPHSLKLEARAERTLSKASGLSISDRPMAGAIAGGELVEGTDIFPFSLFVGAMAMEGGRAQVRLRWKQRLKEERGTGSSRAARKE